MVTLKKLGFDFLELNEYGFKTWYNDEKDIIVEKTKNGYLVLWLESETEISKIAELEKTIQ